jgi:hypothetical protein
MTQISIERLIRRAQKRAHDNWETWCVVEWEEAEEIRHGVMPLDATEYDDFTTFDGRILVVCESDGLVDYVRQGK